MKFVFNLLKSKPKPSSEIMAVHERTSFKNPFKWKQFSSRKDQMSAYDRNLNIISNYNELTFKERMLAKIGYTQKQNNNFELRRFHHH